MAISTLTSIVSSSAVRRRLPIVGAFCILSLGFHNLHSSASLSFNPLTRLSFGSKTHGFHSSSIRMEASNQKTVPSIVVYVTVPNKEAGKKLAASIVKEKLAACVNRVPGVESVYLWQGEIQNDSEELLIIKTRESLLNALTEHVKANHEYDVPEVIAMPIMGGSIPYLEWLKNSTRD
ncbi:protein CutA, chloroplastic [Cynara cardunculus var. scolymus]|uniref:protein CutA, chloroplastic n=1 Tax=Cynara cardunculus var. scolymus TaxID=59895 RepID=UPI000D63082B|nr:protein CutA, chloroplastic [Cynara cardunculus var. scolymus]